MKALFRRSPAAAFGRPSSRARRAISLVALALAACATGTPAERAEREVKAGLAALDDGRPCKAYGRFQAALHDDEDDLGALRHLIQAAKDCGRLDAFTKTAQQHVDQAPSSSRAHYVLGLCLLAGDRGERRGLEELATAHRLEPGNGEYALRLGLALLESERFADAIGPLREAAARLPGDAHPHFPLAVALHRTGHDAAAIAEISAALSLEPSAHDLKEARKLVDLIHDPYRVLPEAARSQFHEGLGWLERDESPQRAVDIFEVLQQQYPQVAVIQSVLGLAYQRVGDGSQAVEHFERAAQLDPTLPDPHLYLGELYYSLRHYDDAIRQYRAALAQDPLLTAARERLAQLLSENGDLPGAAEQLRALVALHGGNADARLALAGTLFSGGDLRGAEDQLRKVLHADGKNLQAKLSLAAVVAKRAELENDLVERRRLNEQARKLAADVLAVQPDNAIASRIVASIDAAK